MPERKPAGIHYECGDRDVGVGGGEIPVPEFSESDYERVVFLSPLIGADAGLQLFGLAKRAELSWVELKRQFCDELSVRLLALNRMPVGMAPYI